MKAFIVVAVFGLFSVASAGVGILTQGEESEALGLFSRLCGSGGDGGEWAGARVWCKFAPGEHVELVNHNVEVPPQPVPDSIVFVQPPPVVFKHNVAVQGSGQSAPRTKIYVLPQRSSHSITSQYQPGAVVTAKPSVYFLKANGEEGYRYGTPAPAGIAGYSK